MRKVIILAIFLFLLAPCVFAKQGYIKLLAVKDTPFGYVGSKADLYLEIRNGNGRVFLNTRPLTKLDTQISTRFAKEVACDYIEEDCNRYDFFYKINAESPIVGGPSAGAAIAVLTVSVLKGYDIDENASVSGTINSGGIVGPIGSLREKIDAASKLGINKVLVPKGEVFIPVDNISYIFRNLSRNTSNESLDLVKYGKERGVEVVEVIELGDALYELTGKQIKEVEGELSVSNDYIKTMGFLSEKLCNRSDKLKEVLLKYEISEGLLDKKKDAYNLTEKGGDAINEGQYYSAASYCFGANVKFHQLILELQNISEDIRDKEIEKVKGNIENFSNIISEKKIKTITDLEAYAVVKERLLESQDYLKKAGDNESDLDDLAYAIERLYSAYSWAYFFNGFGREFELDKDSVRNSCIEKLAEAEERYQYFILFFTEEIVKRDELDLAYDDLDKGDYELCLFKASKAKASIDVVLSLFGVKEDQLQGILDYKLRVVEKNIIRQINKGIFPVIGYSYYEYANSLREDDVYSALLYSEYALEHSNLDLYFKKKNFGYYFDVSIILIFLIGVLVGLLAGLFYRSKKVKKRRRRK